MYKRQVAGGQGFEDVGQADDAGLHGQRRSAQATMVATTVELLVVAARIFGYVAQIIWPRQGTQHLQRQRDMFLDDSAFFWVQGALGNAEVADFIRG